MVTIPPQSTSSDSPARLSQSTLPTMYDLPSESPEEPGLPDEFHDLQPQLLSRTLQLTGYSQDRYFTASDLNLYYDPDHPQWYKRADWFLAVDVPRMYEGKDLRRSYVIWQEKRSPAIVIEFLSEGTEAEDLGRFYPRTGQGEAIAPEPVVVDSSPDAAGRNEESIQEKPPSKLVVYEEYLRVPHYLVYHRQTKQLRYFQLVEDQYQEQSLNASNPLVWFSDLEIGLGIWQGMFEGALSDWLRWCDRQGNWLLTDTEQERLAKEQERQRAKRLAERLWQMGIDPDEI